MTSPLPLETPLPFMGPNDQDWPGEPWTLTAKRYRAFDLAIHRVLADWYAALEDGSYVHRQPDPTGRMDWTERQLDDLVNIDIDQYVWAQRNWVLGNRKLATDAGPGYARLPWPQRVAFAQQLAAVCEEYRDANQPKPVEQ